MAVPNNSSELQTQLKQLNSDIQGLQEELVSLSNKPADTVNTMSEAENISENKQTIELEEMTVSEIAEKIHERLYAWKGHEKINSRMARNSDAILHDALQYATGEFSLYDYIIKIIETAHRKDKKGCDVNAKDSWGLSPLNRIFVSWKGNDFEAILYNLPLVQSLISAGAIIDTFDISDGVQYFKQEKEQVIVDKQGIQKYYSRNLCMTALDELLSKYVYSGYHSVLNNDIFSISTWNPSQEIPGILNTPVVRFLFKTIYDRAEFVMDLPYMTESELKNQLEQQKSHNAFPKPINALVCAYAAPAIKDIRRLSCFERDQKFFINLLKMGKQFYEEDQKLTAEQLKQREETRATTLAFMYLETRRKKEESMRRFYSQRDPVMLEM